jgi:hypothetical protein
MKERYQAKIWHYVLFAAVFLITVLFYIFAIKSVKLYFTEQNFKTYIAASDDAHRANNWIEVSNNAQRAFFYEHDPMQTLMVLKRVRISSEKLGMADVYFDIASQARDRYPENSSLLRVYIDAAFRTGNSAIAAETMHALIVDQGEDDILSAFTNLSVSNDPVLHLTVAEVIGSSQLYANAALLYLLEGDIPKAHEIMSQHTEAEEYRLLKTVIAYDAGFYVESKDFLESDGELPPEFHFLYSDLLLALEDFPAAAAFYRSLIAKDWKESPFPYLNLAWVNEYHYKQNQTLELYEKANFLFPFNIAVTTDYIKKLSLAGDEISQSRIEQLITTHFESAEIRLLKILLENRKILLPGYTAGIWELHNTYPQNEKVAKYLAWILYATGDMEGLVQLLDQYSGSTDEYWLPFYRSVYLIQRGEQEKALLETDDIEMNRKSWELLYNKAVILKTMRRYSEALNMLDEAGRLASGAGSSDILLLLHLQKSRIYLLMNDLRNAEIEASSALFISPDNLEARKILSKTFSKLED